MPFFDCARLNYRPVPAFGKIAILGISASARPVRRKSLGNAKSRNGVCIGLTFWTLLAHHFHVDAMDGGRVR